MVLILILTLVCVITYSFEIVFGLAGTILMLPVLSFFFSAKTLVIYSILPQILVGAIGLARSPKTVRLNYLAGMLAFAVAGGAAGLYLFYFLSVTTFQILLASVITLFGTYLVMAPDRLRLNTVIQRLLDTLAGASQALFGISGPITMTRLMGTFKKKTVVRNYALAFFLSLNIFRGAGYLFHGAITPEIGRMMLVSAPFLLAALWFSNHLHFKVNENLFRRVVSWVILIGGISLFYH